MLQTTYLHEGWEFIEAGGEGQMVGFSLHEWLPASVPGHVHLDLVANGIIADPHLRINERGCQWVDITDWTYRTTFNWSPNAELPHRVLRFEGLDTICEIFLNGERIGGSDNMFVSVEITVTEQLLEGANTLEIRFQSPVRVGLERRAAYFAEEGLSDPIPQFYDRSFVRKAQYMYGWDWGPRLASAGIWRPVSLLEFAARILDVHVASEPVPDDEGYYRFTIQTDIEGEAEVRHSLNAFGLEHLLGPDGDYTMEALPWTPESPEFSEMRIVSVLVSPQMAAILDEEQNEGDIWDGDEEDEIFVEDEDLDVSDDEAGEALEIDPYDARTTRCDPSDIKLLREPDEDGESFEFLVNGKRVWARGANWIPDHSFPSVIDGNRLRDRLLKAKDMGFNMLRIWGGGLYETDEFYTLCDELGIMVWQDFPFACAFYPDTGEWKDIIAAEAAANVKRIRNHPCLALWCGNNENHEMFYNQWAGPEQMPPRYYGLNLYDEVLPQVLAELDPKRGYIATTPIGSPPVEYNKDAKRRGPNSDEYGDQHNWDVWHGRGDWKYYVESRGRFSSEYGFASSCATSVWAKTITEEEWHPHSAAVRWHDKTGKGHTVFHGYVELHYPVSETLEDWVYYSQLNQRDALRLGVEHYRRSKFCRGSLIWQLNDCWPVQSWAILDSDGNYKALGYELRRLYADQMLSLERVGATIGVHLANHGPLEWNYNVRLRAYSTVTGELLRVWDEESGQLDPEGIVMIDYVDLTGLNVSETIIVAESADAAPTWQLLNEPKLTRFSAPTRILISTHALGKLTLKLDGPVVDLMLTSDGDPSPFQDNFITSPGGLVEVRYSKLPDVIEARSLAGMHTIKITRSPI